MSQKHQTIVSKQAVLPQIRFQMVKFFSLHRTPEGLRGLETVTRVKQVSFGVNYPFHFELSKTFDFNQQKKQKVNIILVTFYG